MLNTYVVYFLESIQWNKQNKVNRKSVATFVVFYSSTENIWKIIKINDKQKWKVNWGDVNLRISNNGLSLSSKPLKNYQTLPAVGLKEWVFCSPTKYNLLKKWKI